MLQEAGVDFRDCLERSELVARLDERRRFLPSHVRSRLDALLASRDGDAARGQEQHQHQNDGGARSAALAAAGGFSPAAAAPSLFPDGAGSSFAASGLFLDEQHTVQLFQRCRPSVVHIASAEAASGISGRGGGLPLLDPQRVPRVGMGTGFVWDQLGHVVTNYHVIHNTFEVQVTLADNSKWVAELRGKEPDKDLAVLRIRAPGGWCSASERVSELTEGGSSSSLALVGWRRRGRAWRRSA